MKSLGIDFGTSYIKCADAIEEELISLDKKPGGESVCKIPNIITYSPDNTFKLGRNTYKMKSSENSDSLVTIDKIKTLLYANDWDKMVSENRIVNAVDVTNDIMQCLYDIIHNKNKNENDYYATITVPVCFSERQREIIRCAAEKAGFKVGSVITEPFSSLFYLMRDNLDENHNVLIFDIGGGTLDICLVKIEHDADVCAIKIESSLGMEFGGISINNAIIDRILLKKYSNELTPLIINAERKYEAEWNRAKLFYEVDSIKEEIFTEDYDEDNIDKEFEILYLTKNSNLELKISASEIYKMLDDMNIRDKVYALLEEVIEGSNTLICDDITDVFLTGGTSMIPYFKNAVVDYLLDNGVDDVDSLFELYDELDIEEQAVGSVALGAGIYNRLKSEHDKEIIIEDSIPFDIFSRDSNGNAVTKLKADCRYPSYRSLEYSLHHDLIQSGKIKVYQKLPSETGEVVYIGYIPINDDIKNNCSLYRLGINTNREIFAEFGINQGNKNDAAFVSLYSEYLKIDD